MEKMSNSLKSLALTSVFILTACSGAPNAIKVNGFTNLTTFSQATLDKNNEKLGTQARWAGKIAAVRNNGDISEIEVVLFPSRASGKPQTGDISLGRFKAIVPVYVDPKLYTQGRLITVLGEVAAPTIGQVGNQTYTYQTLNAKGVYLWKDISLVNTDPLNMQAIASRTDRRDNVTGPWSSSSTQDRHEQGEDVRSTVIRNNGGSHSIIITETSDNGE